MTEFVYQAQCKLLEKSDTRVLLSLTIPENLYYFQGHFPEAAILPGVVQLDWVMTYLREHFGVDTTKLHSVDALKFQHIVRPNYQVELSIELFKTNKYAFNFCSEHGQHASGKVVFS